MTRRTAPPPEQEWFHLDGTICPAGWHAVGPNQGRCVTTGEPITPCAGIKPADLWRAIDAMKERADARTQ